MRQLALLTLLASVALLPRAHAQSLGSVDFPTSTESAEAQAAFERGLLLLHSFEYDDARDAFREARQLDPGFAMAAWGEASTHNRPIWMQQDRDAALAVLHAYDQARTTSDDGVAITDREAAYLSTLDALFEPDASASARDKEVRDDAYERAMAQLARSYPGDLDAQSLWALSILGTAHEGRDFATYMRAAAILEGVFARNPEHPGAAHYLIHAYDDAVHAPLGLRPALVYDSVAPDASHALHMPSHIYLALGMWDETAEMNRRSYEAARANSERRGEALNNHGWHALYWRTYAELQRGDAAEAYRLLATARQLAAEDPSTLARTHLVRIRAHVATDLQAFDRPEVDFNIDPSGLSTTTRAIDRFVRASMPGADGSDRAALQALAEAPDASPTVRATALVAEVSMGTDVDVEAALREAAALVAAQPLSFGPPTPVVPPHEALGLWLLDQDRPDEAADAFRAQLALTPGRVQSTARLEEALGHASPHAADAASSERP